MVPFQALFPICKVLMIDFVIIDVVNFTHLTAVSLFYITAHMESMVSFYLLKDTAVARTYISINFASHASFVMNCCDDTYLEDSLCYFPQI